MERINQKTTKQIKRENKNWLLLVTVNDIETNSLLSRLKPLEDYSDILVAYSKNNTYFIGRFGAYNVIHVQSDMGAMNRDAVMTTVDNAIKMWNPRGIIMVGVAWGMNKGKQRIGDVLISKKILQYETAKISNGSTIPRGADTEAGGVLTNRFKSCMDWEYLLEDGKVAKRYMGTVLSGEKLLDDKNYRDKLHSSFPEAIGGEMEGAGLASVAMANNLYEWIIVKGICDWGYDKQSENKDRYQKIAMESAISLCESVLCDDSVLEEILKAENRKKNADNLMLRINAYKLFFYRNSQKITIKELSKLSGISIGHISKCEKINAEENEFSIRIFRETTVATIRSLEKALNLRKGELTADDDDLLAEKYKNYYLKKGYKLYEKVGISGLEREYEEYLKGTNAKYKVNNDNSLTLISHGKKGSDLYLSIDINLVNEINTIIKEELVKAKKHLNTQYLNDAFVIVGNPKTSEVYSLNGQRYLNDNTFTDISLNNINSAFTMGSVVKGATISVGYKYNLIEKGKKILDGCVKLKNKTEKCSFKELGYLDDVSALKMSSNYYQFLIAISLLGKKYTPNMDLNASEKEFNIYRDMLSSYGLGIITGIDLPNEKPGLKGNIISDDLLLNLAIGQYDTYTPIELFNYINTLAMKGKRISPSLVNEIKNNDFIIYKNKHEVVDNVQISNDDFNQIHKGFYEVMNNGTGLGFMNKNLLPAGKTGTSESFIDTDSDGKIDTKTLTLTMAGFFPYDDPKISLIVVCPNTSHNNGKNKDYIYYLTSKISRRITNIFNEQKNSFN